MKQLVHNGIRVTELPAPTGMVLTIRDTEYKLDAQQEQMAMAFVAKRHLGYWEDQIFVRNFLKDFSKILGVKPVLKPKEVDLEQFFREGIARREHEQQQKDAITKEERKALAAERKEIREALREEYGYAEIDDETVEISNWTAEPSCIFMGRGKHPLRGRWKPGPQQNNITLNLSPDAPIPKGNWAGRVWQSDSLWIARWEDKFSGKIKYVWVSDSASIKQEREAKKFELAQQLRHRISDVRQEIQDGMTAKNPRKRQIATAVYLIDVLSLRVGDEKDPDEADTVGATTLRPEHVKIKENGNVEFSFLGKDSVEWNKTVKLPEAVIKELQILIKSARVPNRVNRSSGGHPTRDKPQLFPDVRSRTVNEFLSGIMPGLTAKVFRTYHASSTVHKYLKSSKVKSADPDWLKKYHAKKANLKAAIVCNHTKKEPKGWSNRAKRFRERQKLADERIGKAEENLEKRKSRMKELKVKQKTKLELLGSQGKVVPSGKNRPYASSITTARRSVKTATERLIRAMDAKAKLKTQIKIARNTRTWNLGTSLKSYIDPRIYRDWCRLVDYDWKDFYSTTLLRKFAWIDKELETTET